MQNYVTCHDLRGTLPYMAPELVANPTKVRGQKEFSAPARYFGSWDGASFELGATLIAR